MQFQVPQFIEVEDKIFGPLTFRQFVYMGGGLGSAYIIYRLLPVYIAIPVGICIVAFTTALSFYKYNGRPFIAAVENAFFFLMRTKLYLWNNDRKTVHALDEKQVGSVVAETVAPKLSESKLHELAWSLDIQERIASGTMTQEERSQHAQVLPIRTARDALPR